MSTVAAPFLLLTVSQTADLLNVSDRTVRRWIDEEKVSFLKTPDGSYRLPQGALLASLRGTYDLAGELHDQDGRHRDLTEEQVRQAMGSR